MHVGFYVYWCLKFHVAGSNEGLGCQKDEAGGLEFYGVLASNPSLTLQAPMSGPGRKKAAHRELVFDVGFWVSWLQILCCRLR